MYESEKQKHLTFRVIYITLMLICKLVLIICNFHVIQDVNICTLTSTYKTNTKVKYLFVARRNQRFAFSERMNALLCKGQTRHLLKQLIAPARSSPSMGSTPKSASAMLPDLMEDEDDGSSVSSDQNQFQLQILVTPYHGPEGGTEIKVSGGIASSRPTSRRLPPIHNVSGSQWMSKRSPCSSGNASPRSRYHINCKEKTFSDSIPFSKHRIVPARKNRSTDGSQIIKNDVNSSAAHATMPPVHITADQVSEYLRSHSEFLERYVMEEVELEQLERWIIRRSQRQKKKAEVAKNGRKTSLSRWKFCVHADKRQMLQDLTQSLQLRPTKDHVLWELSNCICSAVGADGYRLYFFDKNQPEKLALYLGPECRNEHGEPKLQKLKPGVNVPSYVARTLEPIRFSKGDVDPRFPDEVSDEKEIAHILCQPIVQPDGQLAAVLELWRRESGDGPFHEEDEEIACSYLVWGGIALHYAHLYLNMNQQRKLNDFLLAVVKSIFQDMVSMDMLIMKIMNFAQRLVDADRASLFLVDSKSKELYATIFDVGVEEDNTESESEESVKVHTSKEIRFPLGTGIAGQVAMTGEILNISDAYSDERFNRTVDQLTGYRTQTILCMPIFIRGSIIGVVQMVNKHTGCFNKEDEEAFQMFAVYCGLALHHAKLYDKIRRSEQKYKVALEVLSYHNSCSEEEFSVALKDGIPDQVIGIDDYYFNPFEIEDYEKTRQAVHMFVDLFGLARFDRNSLVRFSLTVRKNYRRVPYHNWTHGFSVSNCMFSIIKHSDNVFRPNECLALFIGALCHDLDHRGKNNKFMLDTESPLANIYSTSTMEHHHFNQTVTILQQEGHNIFSKLSSSEYKQVLGLVKHCILATDLALFFPNKAKLSQIVQEQSFSWSNQDHRLLIQAIAMTASDLSASAKPWDIQVETVKIIFEEFYQQGDAERNAGRKPIPMMDRNQPDQQAASQVGFLMGICVPCYTLLYTLIPETKPLLNMCQENLRKWQSIDEEIRKKDMSSA